MAESNVTPTEGRPEMNISWLDPEAIEEDVAEYATWLRRHRERERLRRVAEAAMLAVQILLVLDKGRVP